MLRKKTYFTNYLRERQIEVHYIDIVNDLKKNIPEVFLPNYSYRNAASTLCRLVNEDGTVIKGSKPGYYKINQ